MNVYISIGNSDNRLTQQEWVDYVAIVQRTILPAADRVHGNWRSLPDEPFQNACWLIEIKPRTARSTKRDLAEIAHRYRQTSIAWATGRTQFISGLCDEGACIEYQEDQR